MVLWKPDKDSSNVEAGRGPHVSPMLRSGAPISTPARPAVAATSPRPSDNTATSVIGSDLTIIGNLISKGEVQVDGEVQGDIHGTSIIIGERARITGGLVAEEIVVRGQVMGSLRGMRVTLQSSSKVEGDIYHQSLAIEQGAYFEGKSRRTEDPTAGIQPLGLSGHGDAPHFNNGSN